jgi:hypothetical protein
MTTDLDRRIRRGLREYVDSVPVVVPPPVVVVRPAGADRLRRFGLPLVAAAAVVVVAIIPVLVPVGPSPTPAAPVRPPRLPDRFAPFSFLTGDLAAAPVGQAVAVYLQRNNALEDWVTQWQLLVIAADGVRYRRTTITDASPPDPEYLDDGMRIRRWLLSPDGRRLALTLDRQGRTMAVLDLATGALPHIEHVGRDPWALLAWSPDGRRIAYTGGGGPTNIGAVYVQDVETNRPVPLPGIYGARAAAFSPDGRHLAIQAGSTLLVTDATGHIEGQHLMAVDESLAGPAAWSPDGSLLAITRLGPIEASDVGYSRMPQAMRVIAAVDGASPANAPGEFAIEPGWDFQGWRGNDSIVMWDHARLMEFSIDGRLRTTLAETGDEVAMLQLASGLLPTMAVGSVDRVDRGPWPTWARVALGIVLGLAALLILIIVYSYGRRRRRPRPEVEAPALAAAGPTSP